MLICNPAYPAILPLLTLLNEVFEAILFFILLILLGNKNLVCQAR